LTSCWPGATAIELALDDERDRGEGDKVRGLRAPIEEADKFGSVKTREDG
jgi:hypothetical protein